jgi:dipeptidyl aminopeptidase/acylaminoacyl peptidase
MKRTASVAFGVFLMFCATLLPMLSAPGFPQQQKPPVTADDYGRWEALGGGVLSPDGAWLAVSIRRVDGTSELRLHDTTTAEAAPRIMEEGGSPSFSADARWLAYAIGYSEAEREQARDGDEPLRNKLGVLDLRSGEEEIFDDVRSFGFDDTGAFLWMTGYPAEGRDAADLVVRDLADDTSLNFGSVSAHAWQDDAPRLAMTIATGSDAGNGVQLWDATTGRLVPLDSGDATFTGLAWREDAADLAVLRSVEEPGFEEPTHILLAWRDLDTGASASLRFDHRELTDFDSPDEMRVVEHRTPRWAADGSAIFLGIREWTASPEEPEEADERGGEPEEGEAAGERTPDVADEDTGREEPEPADVDVWHARDERIIPMQKLQEQRDREKSYLAVWHADEGRFVRLGNDYDESINVLEGDAFATETDRTPYLVDGMFGRRWYDVDLIDVATGERTRVVDRVRYFYGGSADGGYLHYFKDDQHFAYDVAAGVHVDLTSELPTSFVDEDYDYPVEQKPSWGVAGWSEGDEAVLLYDRYDLWSVRPDGSGALRITDGAADQIRYRHVDLDRELSFGAASEPIDLDAPLWLSMYGEWTKKSGYARVAVSGEGGDPQPLVWLDKNVGRLIKADDAATYAYVVQDFDDSPDYFVGGAELGDATRITASNPFQSDFAWGHSQLVDYACEFGPRVQGALFYPAGYEEGRTYPMITYVYERLSQSVHSYSVPSERSSYNPAVWTSQGYFVLQPDIVYRGRMPGTSAVECIRPAVQTVVDTGMVDADRVGLVGHSWGGYEAAFVPTKTDIFAAAVSGAALTNFFSMFGTIHWNQGMPESSHWETGQARMDVPYWDDMEAYIRESPVIGIPELETPMLMAFGDADGTVDFHQGVEMYNYARRAGKQFVLLVYADENHSNRQKKNQIDYHHRILDWFGHYLKGEPAKAWITEGVSVIERADQIRESERSKRR